MRWLAFCFLFVTGLAAQTVDNKKPPVLRTPEPDETIVFALPGPPPGAPVHTSLPATVIYRQAPKTDTERPTLRRVQHEIPEEYQEDSAGYLKARIGDWLSKDAQVLLGDPLRQRPAYGEEGKENGQIVAFLDPSGRYKELELDFDSETGKLRTVFVYPYSLTWEDCLKNYGDKVQATEANKGRTFYSYVDRRLDVLVDPAGKVISLGMY